MAAITLKMVSLTSRVELVWAAAQQLSRIVAITKVTAHRRVRLRTTSKGELGGYREFQFTRAGKENANCGRCACAHTNELRQRSSSLSLAPWRRPVWSVRR